jgi:hypothetical protein
MDLVTRFLRAVLVLVGVDRSMLMSKGGEDYWLKMNFSIQQRVLILGSSVSIQKNGYLPKLKEELDRLSPNGHIYFNASLGGAPIESAYSYVYSNTIYDIEAFNPTVCIIEKTPNDKIYFYDKLPADRIQETLAKTRNFLRSLVRFLKAKQCEVILLSNYVKPDNCLSWDKDSNLNYLIPMYDGIATQENLLHVNIANFIYDNFNKDEINNFFLDEVHLSESGAEVVAKKIALDLTANSSELHSNSNNLTLQLDQPFSQIDLITLHKSTDHKFDSTLLKFHYDIFDSSNSLEIISNTSGYLSGLFYLSDPSTGWIRIEIDEQESHEIGLFDLSAFMPRLAYRSLPKIQFKNKLSFRVIQKPINYEAALKTYNNSKTFDPNANWAIEKYKKPLLAVMQNPGNTFFKPSVIMAMK